MEAHPSGLFAASTLMPCSLYLFDARNDAV
jgi:hypothetical protein